MPDKEGNDAETNQDNRKEERREADDEPSNSEASNPPKTMATTVEKACSLRISL